MILPNQTKKKNISIGSKNQTTRAESGIKHADGKTEKQTKEKVRNVLVKNLGFNEERV